MLPEGALKLKLEELSKGEPLDGAAAEAVLVGEVIVSDSSSWTFCMLPLLAARGLKEPPPPKGLLPRIVVSAIAAYCYRITGLGVVNKVVEWMYPMERARQTNASRSLKDCSIGFSRECYTKGAMLKE